MQDVKKAVYLRKRKGKGKGKRKGDIEMTTQQDNKKRFAPDDMNRNPTGKGGFGDNPQNRNPGGWRKEVTIPYQMQFFLSLSIEEIEKWEKENPPKKRTPAQQIALNSVKKSLEQLDYQKETTDRTSGRATIFQEISQEQNVVINEIRTYVADDKTNTSD